MLKQADFVEEQREEGRAIRFVGRLTLARIGDIPKRLDKLDEPPAIIDISELERIDTVGAWLVHKLTTQCGAKVIGASTEAVRLIDLVDETGIEVQMRPKKRNIFSVILAEIGATVTNIGQTLFGMLGFFGAIMISVGATLRHPSRFRLNALIQRFEMVGVRALGIIGLMNFLVGFVIAQAGAYQLADYGAEAMTVNLVGRLSIRELGVLMTAIMVAGRSGSSFAAQLGTMKLTEEVDAMRTIGVSPVEALVLPRVIAAVLMMPLLSFFAAAVAIFGGGVFCWMSLDIPPPLFVARLQETVRLYDIWVGLIKAPVFGAIIAMTGCYQGMIVKSNAEEVGLRTTSAVVQAIFFVVALNAFFAIFFQSIGWG